MQNRLNVVQYKLKWSWRLFFRKVITFFQQIIFFQIFMISLYLFYFQKKYLFFSVEFLWNSSFFHKGFYPVFFSSDICFNCPEMIVISLMGKTFSLSTFFHFFLFRFYDREIIKNWKRKNLKDENLFKIWCLFI